MHDRDRCWTPGCDQEPEHVVWQHSSDCNCDLAALGAEELVEHLHVCPHHHHIHVCEQHWQDKTWPLLP